MTLLEFGTRTCQCRACGEHFSAPTTFDQHRVGPMTDRRCQTAREMSDSGLKLNARGIWTRPSHETVSEPFLELAETVS